MADVFKEGGKAFGRGFCGCLGAWVASLLLIIPLLLIVSTVVVPVIAGFLEELPGLIESLLAPMGPEGLPEGPGPGAAAPTPTGELPRLEVWLTAEDDPNAERLTTVKLEEAPEAVYYWVKGPEGASVSFQLWVIGPGGMRESFGPNFMTDPGGKAVSCGYTTGPPPGPGTYKIEALIGETVMGSTTVEVTSQ